MIDPEPAGEERTDPETPDEIPTDPQEADQEQTATEPADQKLVDAAAAETKPRRPRRRVRFTLRTLLVLVLLLSLPLAYLAVRIRRGQVQQRAAGHVNELGGMVVYYHQLDMSGNYYGRSEPGAPRWVRSLLGDDVFRQVVAVNLHQCEVHDDDLPNFTSLEHLAALDLGCTQVTDRGLVQLAAFANLESLDLHNTKITNDGLQHLKPLTKLKTLNISGTAIGDEGLVHLATLPALSDVRLTSTKITDDGLAMLAALPNLKHLQVADTEVSDACIDHLAAADKLRSINLHKTYFTDDGVQRLRRLLPELMVFGDKRSERWGFYESGLFREISPCEERNVSRGQGRSGASKWTHVLEGAKQRLREQAVRVAYHGRLTESLTRPGAGGIVPRSGRWEIRFDVSSPDAYARQLDELDIEIAVPIEGQGDPLGAAPIDPSDWGDVFMVFYSDLSQPTPAVTGKNSGDLVALLPMSEEIQQLNRQLIAKGEMWAEEPPEDQLTFYFLPPELAKTLGAIELDFAGLPDERGIRKTVFGLRRNADDNWEPFVLELEQIVGEE